MTLPKLTQRLKIPKILFFERLGHCSQKGIESDSSEPNTGQSSVNLNGVCQTSCRDHITLHLQLQL